ncbi:hypothetical protein [Saccharibacillus kuerlensis]|uniref:DUF2269 family protein n=1 Tax=Saccharibacillus kuerlensis TaxID=459527 RepID=A0ABQ2KSI2_9BACL|nr:hypothetical protein [Saccharibacillus kuerlensis]GGN91998.1 hypothetical protein GCM10010969_04010 [Saccharibacillus kuerlensis]
MDRFILFLHVLGAVAMGFYLLAPLIVAQLSRLEGEAKKGVLSVMRSLNTYAQFGLVLELLTGVYLFLQGDYSTLWIVLTFVLFLLIGAFGGMMGGPLRRALNGIQERRDISSELRKLQVFSTMVCVSFVAILFVMMFHRWFA